MGIESLLGLNKQLQPNPGFLNRTLFLFVPGSYILKMKGSVRQLENAIGGVDKLIETAYEVAGAASPIDSTLTALQSQIGAIKDVRGDTKHSAKLLMQSAMRLETSRILAYACIFVASYFVIATAIASVTKGN